MNIVGIVKSLFRKIFKSNKKDCLTDTYYKALEGRVVPLNMLQRYIEIRARENKN